jgi:hypothetical protein
MFRSWAALPAPCRRGCPVRAGPARSVPVPARSVPRGGTTGAWSGGAARSSRCCAGRWHNGALVGWRGPFVRRLCRGVAQRGPGRVARPVPAAVVPAGGTTGAGRGGAIGPCVGCAAGWHSGGLAGWRGPFAPRLCRRVAQRGLVAPSGAMTGVRPAERPLRHRFEPRSCHRTARRAPGRRPSPAEQPPVLRHLRRSRSAARRAAAIRPRPDRSPRSA